MTSKYRKYLMIYRYRGGKTATAVLLYPDAMPRDVSKKAVDEDAKRIGREVGAKSYTILEAQ